MKEQITKFNLEAAFKALNEIEVPKVNGMKANKPVLKESLKPTPKTDCLLEDYYDVNNGKDLEAAKADRAEEVAQAKLAKIEKIVDLDAETPEDIQPSYVGKTIIQCPQCMTLFYKDPADVNVSEEDQTLVNVGEKCPNCNNESGYTVIGKVAAEEPAVEETPVEESELDLNFEEPAAEEENNEEEKAEGASTEENSEEEINLEPVEEPAEENKEEEKPEEEEKKEESFEPHSENILAEQVENALKESEIRAKDNKVQAIIDRVKRFRDECAKNGKHCSQKDAIENCCSDDEKALLQHIETVDGKVVNALKEEVNTDELTKKLKEHDEYIKVLQDEIKAEEDAVKNAKNDFIKKMHENNLEALKDALDKAIPEEVKAEAAIEELPTAEDAAEDMTKNEALEEEKCPVCGDELDGKEPCEKCKKELKEEECPKCGKDVKDPCETDREAYHCKNNLEDEIVDEALEEDIIAKDAPEKADDIELKQKSVGGNHKGKKGEVPNSIVEESLNESEEITKAEIDELLDSDEFKTPVSEAEFQAGVNREDTLEALEEVDDKTLTECITNSLTTVYENVDSFELTDCEINNDKFIVEGKIHFKSGLSKDTKYIFIESINNGPVIFEGKNETLDANGKFILTGTVQDAGKILYTESLAYNYHIGENLVEGLSKK